MNHAIQATSKRTLLVGLGALLLLPTGCFVEFGSSPSDDDPDPTQLDPRGPVATNADEAWPTKPDSVPQLEEQQIAEACAMAGACIPDREQFTQQEMLALIELCVANAVWSGERAIPMSSFAQDNERAEFFVGCVFDNAGDCSAVNACRTDRAHEIYCEEDGCRLRGDASFDVSCNGDIATFSGDTGTFTRDCSRAFAQCDPQSPTGCTDRQFTACAETPPVPDRCDGNVRLGCDSAGQVSYRDCERLGGSCGEATDGSMDCIYPDRDAACLGDEPARAACDADVLGVCVNGKRVSFSAPDICTR